MAKGRLLIAVLLAPPMALVFAMLPGALIAVVRGSSSGSVLGGAGYVFFASMLIGGFVLYLVEFLVAVPAYLVLRGFGLRMLFSTAAAGAIAALLLSLAVLLFGGARDRGHWEYLPTLLFAGAAAGAFVWALGLRGRVR